MQFTGSLQPLDFISHLGGFMLSSSIDFSGEEMAYLYPDGRTTLLGTFHKEKMVQVKTAVTLKVSL